MAFMLKGIQSCKLCNSKNIASMHMANTEIFMFIAVLFIKLLMLLFYLLKFCL